MNNQQLLIQNNAAYDQFDALVREAWKTMPPQERENLNAAKKALEKSEYGKWAAILLGWATCTMAKRDAEENLMP